MPFAQTSQSLRNRNTTTCNALLARDISHNVGIPVIAGHAIVLSGGSLNGAFGAGFLLGLQDKHRLPPEPNVVTGVSTGSLQSTLVFLAREPVAADRKNSWVDSSVPTLVELPGADHELPLVAGRTNLEDLALAYSITRENEILKPAPLKGIGVVFRGAIGSLDPLRQRLMAIITPDTITQIATEACRGRLLMVGVADVDDGNGYALDLTELALSAFTSNPSTSHMTDVRQAYVSALLASSSVPLGAAPVVLKYQEYDENGQPIDNTSRQHMFIDGGARYGVFLPVGSDDYDVSLVVNTTLATRSWDKSRPPAGKWLLINLIPRVVEDMLENQVYQLSVGQVEYGAGKLHMAYISNRNVNKTDGKASELPMNHIYRGLSCGQWHDKDEKAAPLQFYPGYMACLIDYGRSRGDQEAWNLPATSSSVK